MRPDKLIVGVGIFIVMITAGLHALYSKDVGNTPEAKSFFENYNVISTDSEFSDIPQEVNRVYNVTSGLKEDMIEQEVQAATGWENMVTGGYTALKSFFATFAIAGDIIEGIAVGSLGIPKFFVDFAMVAFAMMFIFMVLFMLFRFMPRD